MHFLLTRPQQDSDRLKAQLTALGHQVSCAPLLRIDYLSDKKITLDNFQAVLFTSANGVRAFSAAHKAPDLPCLAVGDATASEARDAGFQNVTAAGGDVDRLTELARTRLDPNAGPLLHISGKHQAGDLKGQLTAAGFQVTTEKLYQAIKSTTLSPEALDNLRTGRISHMPFYSPRTARTFVELARAVDQADLLRNVTALCLSPAIADVISCLDWQNIQTAPAPDQKSLFRLIDITIEGPRQ
ncbi:uroporphyrinogen-III synthase [Paremcibacter congregatus]|uniref:uroporphyrinogen-III synthase n=1 Tax=Paremcibacter congregatus TaxID=2043170 RepID=UPI0030EF2B94|tara:strand:- start:10437 stop:11162 length:726 start_codon:yes stop_codon:yes gene_type:complete